MQEKRAVFEFLLALPKSHLREPSILIGDFNTGKHYIDEKGKTFYCAKHFCQLETVGWIDAWRQHHGDRKEFTWFSNANNGFRVDHAFVSPTLFPRVRKVWYSHRERELKISDHSVLLLDLD
jgi:exonuclease III